MALTKCYQHAGKSMNLRHISLNSKSSSARLRTGIMLYKLSLTRRRVPYRLLKTKLRSSLVTRKISPKPSHQQSTQVKRAIKNRFVLYRLRSKELRKSGAHPRVYKVTLIRSSSYRLTTNNCSQRLLASRSILVRSSSKKNRRRKSNLKSKVSLHLSRKKIQSWRQELETHRKTTSYAETYVVRLTGSQSLRNVLRKRCFPWMKRSSRSDLRLLAKISTLKTTRRGWSSYSLKSLGVTIYRTSSASLEIWIESRDWILKWKRIK